MIVPIPIPMVDEDLTRYIMALGLPTVTLDVSGFTRDTLTEEQADRILGAINPDEKGTTVKLIRYIALPRDSRFSLTIRLRLGRRVWFFDAGGMS